MTNSISYHGSPQEGESNPGKNNEESTVTGVISRVTFHNPENGYSVLQVSTPRKLEAVTVVGTFLKPSQGINIHARGRFITHNRFGDQFQASVITEIVPSTLEGIEKYLSSGLIKGIGPKTAQRLMEKFGENTLEVICREPEKIAAVPGIGKAKAKLIHNTCAEQRESQDTMRFLVEHGISPKLGQKIIDKYKNKTIEIISNDPYLLARQLRGVGFQTADRIALQLGVKAESPQRLKAGLYYALERAADDGHCFLPPSELFRRASALLGIGNETDLSEALEELIREDFITRRDETVYLKHLAAAEDFVAKFIAQRSMLETENEIGAEDINSALKAAASELEIEFSQDQKEAVYAAARNSVIVITGGPGCGKTTLIKALSHLFRGANLRLMLAAPTGRAAQRMAQVCEYPASTIHRLLKYDPRSGTFTFGINDPLPADAVIVDEASMIDISLAKDLFSAIPKNAKLILVGDKDQLPSVGPGRVFADLIASQQIKTIQLTKLFRRAEDSNINDIAFMINSGLAPNIPEPDGVTKTDSYFIPKRDPEDAAHTIQRLVSDHIPRKFSIKLADITVLTPSNRGVLGTVELNKGLQAKLNPPTALGIDGELEVGDNIFRIGDRVCQRVNNYQIDPHGVFNGDVGQIYSIERAARRMVVELWDGRLIKYESGDLHQLSLAYAVTVHRSQGSEIPCVVLALTDAHFTLLERQLIYTAVTRAKKLLILVGSKRALEIACRRINTQKRCTALKERIETFAL